MKRMITILSFLVAASSFAATNQTINATLNVVNATSEVVLSVTTTALTIGDVPIIAGTTKESNKIEVKVTGTQAKAAKVTMPDKVKLTSAGGAAYDAGILVDNVKGGAVTTAGGTHTILSSGKLGDGAKNIASLTADTKAKLDISGTEKPGVYTGNMTISAQYN